MAYTLEAGTSEVFTFEQALEYCEENVDPLSLESLLEHAWVIRALGNNRAFLSEIINEDIKRAMEGVRTRIYTPQSVMFGSTKSFTFRGNFWFIPTWDEARHDLEVSLYSYATAHDHNFNFATIGYFGSGYTTDIYEYDRDKVAGLPGERVAMRFLETTTLPAGKVMVFRSGRDIHTQHSPDEFSISLNLIVRNLEELAKPQYFFDPRESRITGYVNNRFTGRFSLFKFARYLGNAETVELLDHFKTHHDEPFMRAASYDALGRLAPETERDRIAFELARDPDPLMARRIEKIREFAI